MNNQANDQGNNQKNDQVNPVGGKWDGRKANICFGCGQEGYFSGDKKCPVRGRACRKCGGIGHFKVKCFQVQQRSGGELGSRTKLPDKKGATCGGRGGGNNRGGGGGRRDVERHERQTLWLVEIKVENLPDLSNIAPNLHFQ